jgi:Surp module
LTLYVAKNGIEFERKLIDKQSQMFSFLKEDNEFHAYYKTKVKQNISSLNIQTEPPEAPKIAPLLKEKEEEAVKKMPKAPPPPICFSIKAKQEKSPKLAKSSAMMASSNSDEEQKEKKSYPDCPSPPKISEVEEELERQVDIVNAEREEKLAKERLSDKLLISARERLGMLPKEKMLQIERKKKLMMFISEKIKSKMRKVFILQQV